MKHGVRMIRIILLIFSLLLLFSPVYCQEKRPDELTVVSYKNVDVREFNILISSSEKKKENWIFYPLSIAMKFHKVSAFRFVNINQKSDRAECPLKSIVTIVEEGFLDDEMRGKWVQIHFERKDCLKAWRIKEVREAYLCGREGSEKVFLKELCPSLP